MDQDRSPHVRRLVGGVLCADRRGTVSLCSVPGSGFPLAHLGCRHVRSTVQRVGDLPASLRERCERKYGRSWSRAGGAAARVGAAIARAVESVGLRGALLVDTMRGGSDYWRPGKLLGQAADEVRAAGLEVEWARDDRLCPAASLLRRFRDDTEMAFGLYAEAYEAQLEREGELAVRTASLLAIEALSREQLPVFYCTDPYLPGYGSVLRPGDATPWAERTFATDPRGYLREHGCHRIVLVTRLARYLASLEVDSVMLELDANVGAVYRRAGRGRGDDGQGRRSASAVEAPRTMPDPPQGPSDGRS